MEGQYLCGKESDSVSALNCPLILRWLRFGPTTEEQGLQPDRLVNPGRTRRLWTRDECCFVPLVYFAFRMWQACFFSLFLRGGGSGRRRQQDRAPHPLSTFSTWLAVLLVRGARHYLHFTGYTDVALTCFPKAMITCPCTTLMLAMIEEDITY